MKDLPRTEIVFVLNHLPDLQTLVAGVPAGVETHVLDASGDALAQMAALLDGRSGIEALHLLCHGSSGALHMGSATLERANLPRYATLLNTLSKAMAEDGQWLIYGCNVAEGADGRHFVQALRLATGLNVAAASHKVGAQELGGSWELDYGMTGQQKALALPQWHGALMAVNAGDAVIDLGASGKLIAPVQVEGKWYYFWDRSGDGTKANTGSLNGSVDTTTHDVLDGLFNHDINGVTNTTVTNIDGAYGTTDTYRYATIGGLKLALPTANGSEAYPQGIGVTQSGTVYTDAGASSNGTTSIYNDLLAIWDAYNSTDTGAASGAPPGWAYNTQIEYWSATPSTPYGHATITFTGYVQDRGDTNNTFYVALQLVAPSVTSTPTDVSVIKDTASNFDLSAVTFADEEGKPLTATLTASAGTFAASNSGSVTVSGTGTGTLTLAGTVANLNAWLDTVSNIKYTGASNVSGNNAATFTLKANDGTVDSSVASGNIDIVGPPTVTGVTSSTANASYKAGVPMSIQVAFSEAVTVTGTPQLTLETGSTDRTIDYTSGTGTDTLTFSYTVQAGDTSSDLNYTNTTALALNSGTINATNGGLAATLTLASPGAANSLGANKAIVIDTLAPTTTVVTTLFSADTGLGNIGRTDLITNTAAQNVSGTLSTNLVTGEIVQVSLDNGTTWVTATTTVGQNSWRLASQTLVGSNTIKVRVADAAGNAGSEASRAYVLDTAVPTASVTTVNVTIGTNVTTSQSTETGFVFLVKSTDTPRSLNELDQFAIGPPPRATIATVTTINTNTELGTSRLTAGTYNVYAVDVAGNISAASANTLTLVEANRLPVITSNGAGATASINITENATAVTTVITSDADVGQTSSFSITGGADQAKFSINATTGALTLVSAPNFESPTDSGANNTYEVTVTADDGHSGTDVQTITVSVTNLDEVAPTFTSGATATAIAENSGANQVIYTASSTDTTDYISGATTYSLKPATGDVSAFSINATTGAVTLTGNPDFEAKSSYAFTVVATDAANNSSEKAVTLAINNLDEVAPAITSDATAAAIAENSGAAQVVYTVTSTDTADISAGVSYSLGGTDAGLFSISSSTGAVTLTANPNFEAKSSYAFTVKASDGVNTATEQAVSLAINNLDEVAPTITSGATATAINENSGATQVVYTVTSADTGDAASAGVSYSLKEGSDAALFSINGTTGAVTLTANPNFEAKSSYAFTVKASDGVNTATEQAVSLAINNVNEGHTGNVSISGSAVEGQTLSASDALADPDGLGSISYEWYANGAAVGSGASHTLSKTNVGKNIIVQASYVGKGGYPENELSAATDSVAALVDGTAVVIQSTTQGAQTTTTQTVAPVTVARSEDTSTVNTTLADIPLATDSSGAAVVQVSLPVGVGLTSSATVTASGSTAPTLREQLIAASDPRVGDATQMSQIIANGIDQYVPTVTDSSQVTVPQAVKWTSSAISSSCRLAVSALIRPRWSRWSMWRRIWLPTPIIIWRWSWWGWRNDA
ncbi:MAG: DUF4347 domain-containing protein [Comamonadaceae bacterium]|nr:MAG: DUF4347 domain-containing protein [Comamonadaceae bacterium]